MRERILKLALELTGGGEGNRMLLAALCAVAEDAWLARLREGVAAEDCGEALPCAWRAAASGPGGRKASGRRRSG